MQDQPPQVKKTSPFAIRWACCAAVALLGLTASAPTTWAAEPVKTKPTASPAQSATSAPSIQRSLHQYKLPAVTVQGSDGVNRRLSQALDDGRPVVMTFMYSSCTTVCPISNLVLAQFEQALGNKRADVNVVSISIDPSYDSVQRLRDFAKQTGARGSFYTSDPGTSEEVQRAFDAWRGDKMNHQPVFLLRANGRSPWVRLDGMVSASVLQTELQLALTTAVR
jgi:protein SCO1